MPFIFLWECLYFFKGNYYKWVKGMGIFTQVNEIERLANELGRLVRLRYREVVEDEAEDIAKDLVGEKGLRYVCMNIDDVIYDDYVEERIKEAADSYSTYNFDNALLATFDPYPEMKEVDDYFIYDLVSTSKPENVVDTTIGAYAYELWRVGIKNSLKEKLKEMCRKAGYL